MGILSQFGVAWPKFIAQVIIFLCVYFILKKYAFGPVTAILEERRQRIAEGEENLKKIKKQLADSQATTQAKLDEANATALRLIAEAKESAAAVAEKQRQAAQQEAADIIAKARAAATIERDHLLGQLKKDFGRLVIDATSKATGKVLNNDDQERISRETVAQMAS